MELSADQARVAISERLRARVQEIEHAALTRVYGISEPAETADPEYTDGLRAAVASALDYGLNILERGEEYAPPIPTALLVQARLAARNAVSLDTVLRRYFAGFSLLGDFVIEEAERSGLLGGEALKRLLGAQAALFDRVIAAVSEEYAREAESRLQSVEQRRAYLVKRLLAGELIDTSELSYDFGAHHLAAVASGPGVDEALRELATGLDRRLLLVGRGEGAVWVWLGSRRPLDLEELERFISRDWPARASLALGEPAEGIAGWRLSHRQARAAMPIALRSPQSSVRYAEVALLASVLGDDLLATSLRQLYLEPLARERDGGEVLRETLRAYFAAHHNVSSAAAALRINRHTVTNRLRTIEELLGRPLDTCSAEIDAVLRLEDLDDSLLPYTAFSRA